MQSYFRSENLVKLLSHYRPHSVRYDLLQGDGIGLQQEREKWADWANSLVQPILPGLPFPVKGLFRHRVYRIPHLHDTLSTLSPSKKLH